MLKILTTAAILAMTVVPSANSFAFVLNGIKMNLHSRKLWSSSGCCVNNLILRPRANDLAPVSSRTRFLAFGLRFVKPVFMVSPESGSGEDFVKSQRLDVLDEAELLMQAGESYLPFGKIHQARPMSFFFFIRY
jgi:hypothetical protein